MFVAIAIITKPVKSTPVVPPSPERPIRKGSALTNL